MSNFYQDFGYLTTHVLDTALGTPAKGLNITLFSCTESEKTFISVDKTNADGRLSKPILEERDFKKGTYELLFDVLEYFSSEHKGKYQGFFYDKIPIRFQIKNTAQHYHVPLLLSPFGYSTYRGS